VAHAFDTALPGWLVLIPRRHVTAIADLSDAEAAGLGWWQVRLSRALREVTGCQKTYVVQFAEAEGFSHVHFHVLPRPADLPAEHRGPRVFGLLGAAEGERVSADRDGRGRRGLDRAVAPGQVVACGLQPPTSIPDPDPDLDRGRRKGPFLYRKR
jgi:diadenosine tetraphosphate (Ap4A) HIT family hydrolase